MTDLWMIRLLLIAATAVSCTQLIRGKTPALALLISVAAILALLGILLPKLQVAWQTALDMLSRSGLEGELFAPVLKVLAITLITNISAELCRDAGERAIAAKLELCGAAASLLSIFPLAEQAMMLIGALGQ